MRRRLRNVMAGTASALGLVLAACSGVADGDGGDEQSTSRMIGVLLPGDASRYEEFDRPVIERTVSQGCPDCQVSYSSAAEDAALQKRQFHALLTQGVDVIILDAVDAEATGPWVADAAAEGVPVVAYDRLAEGAVEAYVSYDAERIGRLQGRALLNAWNAERASGAEDDGDVRGWSANAEGNGRDEDSAEEEQNTGGAAQPRVVMINGSPADPNTTLLRAGAREVLDGAAEVVYEQDIDGWHPGLAAESVTAAVHALGADGFDAVHVANDAMAGEVIRALQNAEAETTTIVGGQDAELAALQRIVAGEQAFTVYKDFVLQAETAARITVRLLEGEEFDDLAPERVDSPTTEDVPTALLDPAVVTERTIVDTVIADGFRTAEEICVEPYAEDCAELDVDEG